MAETFICAVAQFSKLAAAFDCRGRLTIHHIRDHGSPKDDTKTIPLCEGHHQHDFSMFAIERLGKVKFEQYAGLNLQALIKYYNETYGKERSVQI